MKLSTLRGEVTIPKEVNVFALILSLIDGMCYVDRHDLIKRIIRYYGVTL